MTTLQKMYIDELDLFCAREYGAPAYTGQEDLEHIGVLYTTTEDEAHEVQVEVDISNEDEPKTRVLVDGIVLSCEADDPEEFLEDIPNWSFDGLFHWAMCDVRLYLWRCGE